MNKEQKKKLEEIQSQIEEMLCDEQEKYDNSPENLQNTERSAMNVKEVLKKYEEDKLHFLKNAKHPNSPFPFDFADYMVKYADADVLKKWEEEAGIRDKNIIIGRFTKPVYSDERGKSL